METEEEAAKQASTFVNCKTCGDNILEDFLERHVAMNHPQPPPTAATPQLQETAVATAAAVMVETATAKAVRECPVCGQDTRSEQMIKHCKLAHKVRIHIKILHNHHSNRKILFRFL